MSLCICMWYISVCYGPYHYTSVCMPLVQYLWPMCTGHQETVKQSPCRIGINDGFISQGDGSKCQLPGIVSKALATRADKRFPARGKDLPAERLRIKFNWGVLPLNARKYKLGITPNNGGVCPLCPLPDNTDHFTTTCQNPVLHGMRTNTHN